MGPNRLTLLPLLAIAGATCADAGTIAALQSTNGTSINERNFVGVEGTTNGWSFIVGAQDLELDALGLYDPGAGGLVDSHDVGIWTSGGSLLAEVTIPSGTAAVDDYLYESVSPLTLTAGTTYVLGATFAAQQDLCGSSCGDSFLIAGTETFAPDITFDQSRQTVGAGGGSLAFPDVNAGAAEGLFGPNFLIATTDQSDTPEPASLLLATSGIGALFLVVLRSNRRSSEPLPRN